MFKSQCQKRIEIEFLEYQIKVETRRTFRSQQNQQHNAGFRPNPQRNNNSNTKNKIALMILSFFLCTRSSNPNDLLLLLFSSAKESLLQLPYENGWPTRKEIVRIFRALVATSQVIVGKGTHAGPGLGEAAKQPNVHKHDTIYARIKPLLSCPYFNSWTNQISRWREFWESDPLGL